MNIKNIKISLIIILMTSFLTGCGIIPSTTNTTNTTNIEKKYRNFWKYSLGEYELKIKRKKREYEITTPIPKIDIIEYDEYTFSFLDQNNKLREISIDDFDFREEKFEEKLISEVVMLLSEETEDDYKKIDKVKLKSIFDSIGYVRRNYKKIDEKQILYDEKKGIKFKDINSNNLAENNLYIESYETNLYIYDIEEMLDPETGPAIEQLLKDTYGFLLKKYNQTSPKVIINVSQDDPKRTIQYVLTYDGINYNLTKEEKNI